MNAADIDKYKIEAENDYAAIQQVSALYVLTEFQISGGFGDSSNLDEETIKALVKQQREAEARQKANLAEQAKWNIDTITEEYTMESNMFDYESLKAVEGFGIKKY